MALIKQYETEFGDTYTNAYWRIIEVNCNWENKTARIYVSIYKNKVSRTNGKRPIIGKGYEFTDTLFDSIFGIGNLDTNNPIKAGYNYLKSLPEYSDAVDDLIS